MFGRSSGVKMEEDKLEVNPVVIEPTISYHDALGVPHDATAQEIAKAYKRQSLRWHPDRNLNNIAIAERRFKEINDAYNALVDPETMTLKVLQKYEAQVYTGPLMEGMHKSVVTEELSVTLEELFRGCNKTIHLKRGRMVNGDIVQEKKCLVIPIMPGWTSGTRLCYPDQGDQLSGGRISDLVYEIKQVPHTVYRRSGDDIEHRHYLNPDPAKRKDIRLEMLTNGQLGKIDGPLTPYCNILSELCAVGVTMLEPHPLPKEVLSQIEGSTGPGEVDGDGLGWKPPVGKGIKLKDKEMTASRIRLPGALQAALGKQIFRSRDGIHSVSWKITKKAGDEVVVGLAPTHAHCDRRFHSDVAKGKWGIVWCSDGSVYNLGSSRCKVTIPSYEVGDVLQISVHIADGQLFMFKNKELVFRIGEKIVVSTSDKKPGDVETVEGHGMPVLRGNEIVGRGDLHVSFLEQKKVKVTTGASEAGSEQQLADWLEARHHPPAEFTLEQWKSDTSSTGMMHQARVALKQKRPFPPDGKFDEAVFMGKMQETAQGARDNVAFKAVRMLNNLTNKFPEVHKALKEIKRKEPSTPQEEPQAKRMREEPAPLPPRAPAQQTSTDDID
eukprot:TRINITY_DN8180_c0_g1_i1.p1 TRINITY_DN8180_c0_g1~~TRINITY_DN8180_c0_g1_i1.p1  ORF type:complete len:610 (+),score=192.58 TRINITY_DN8180_c0_g1_i1:958-2787(+)